MNYPQQPNAAYHAPEPMTAELQGVGPLGQRSDLKAHNHGNGYGSKWLFGFWDWFSPVSTCCLSCWCPCVLYGKTCARERGEGEKSGCNWMVGQYLRLFDWDLPATSVLRLVLRRLDRVQLLLAMFQQRTAERATRHRWQRVRRFLWGFLLSLLRSG